MAFRIQVRRDTAANWEINNPVLLSAEMGYETDTGYLKFGDGQTDWNQLDYFTAVGETEVQIQYSGTPIGSYRILNFTGAGATLAPGVTNTVNITIPGAGPVGPTGQVGPTGPAGTLNVSDVSGTVVTAATGMQFLGSGVSVTNTGSTAIVTISPPAGTDSIYNSVSRYRAYNSGGQIWLVSSSTVYTSVSWTRAGNTITMTRNNHGHIVGEGLIVRNVNVDNEYCTIITVTPNTFSFDVSTTSGSSSGDEGAYSMGFTTASVTASGSTIVGPSGGDAQLLSMMIATGTRTGTTYNLTLPQSSKNGAGANTSVNDIYFPVFRAQNLVAGTIVNANFTIGSPYNVMVLTGLPSSDSVGLRLNF